MNRSSTLRRSARTALALAIATVPFWGAAAAQAQGVTLVFSNPIVNAAPGQTDVTFSGTITNTSGEPVSLTDANLSFLTGPDTTSVTPDIVFLPPSLGQTDGVDNTYTGDLFQVDVDPAAANGLYGGLFSFDYTGDSGTDYSAPADQTVPNFSVNVQSAAVSAVPEPSQAVVFLAAGMVLTGLMLSARRRSAAMPQ